MSNPNAGLVLHLTFEDIEKLRGTDQSGKDVEKLRVIDQSGSDNHAAVAGAPKLIPDDEFGSCLSFNGQDDRKDDHILLPNKIGEVDYSHSLTLEAWVFFAALNPFSCVFDLNNGREKDNLVLAGANGKLTLQVYQGSEKSEVVSGGTLKAAEWVHVAGTVDENGKGVLYINGEAAGDKKVLKPTTSRRSNNYIGKSSSNEYFKGKVASARIYNRALSAAEIHRDMLEDESASATFRSSYPLNFRLYDSHNGEPIVYVTDLPEGRDMTLEIGNVSRKAIAFASPTSQQVGALNHHLELLFRPGTLSQKTLDGRLAITDGDWLLHKPTIVEVEKNGGFVSLYFLRKSGLTISPAEKISFLLKGISANAGAGERGTRCELKFSQMSYSDDPTPLKGFRTQQISVLSHAGQKSIPLTLALIGSNTILNDGSDNELRLIIANHSDQPLPLIPGEGDQSSRFVISFAPKGNQGIGRDWALGTESDVNSIRIDTKTPGWSMTGKEPKRELTTTANALKERGEIEITISNIKTSLPSGPTNMYVSYKNIPGHWGGQVIVPIEKAPIKYRDNKVWISTNAEISGTAGTPVSIVSALKIQSSDKRGTGLELKNTTTNAETWQLFSAGEENSKFAGKLMITARDLESSVSKGFYGMTLDKDGCLCIRSIEGWGVLTVGGNIYARGGSISWGPWNERTYNFIEWQGDVPSGMNDYKDLPKVSESVNNGACIYGYDGGILGTTGSGKQTALHWDGNGDVRIRNRLAAKAKYFKIDHPGKAGYSLVHACLEGPEMAVYYRGSDRLTDGKATVKLPEYFEALTLKQDRTVILTAKGREPYLLSYEDIHNGEFKVYGTKSDGEFSWEVKAVRADVEQLQVEAKRY